MPVEFPTYQAGGPPHPLLAAFIISTRDFLAELVQSSRYPNGRPLFYEQLIPELRAAWNEAYPMFDTVAKETLRINDRAIYEHGLHGAQLRLKFSVIRFLHARYLNIPGVGQLRRLIEAIDTLLKSILGAAGVGEGIKEIKEYIEHSLTD